MRQRVSRLRLSPLAEESLLNTIPLQNTLKIRHEVAKVICRTF
jgi:hypothetical protein